LRIAFSLSTLLFLLGSACFSQASQSLSQSPYSQSPLGNPGNTSCTPEQRVAGLCGGSTGSDISAPTTETIRPPVIQNDAADGVPAESGTTSPPAPATSHRPAAVETNEFQDLVTLSVGRRLPIFGSDLFQQVPETFAPDNRTAVPDNYILGPGEEVFVRAWGAVNINYRAVVDRNGDIYLPQVGQIHVAGTRFADLRNVVDSSVHRVFRNYELNVSLGRLRSIQVFVVGQAKRPGNYTISGLSTLLNALFVTGGPTTKGSMRQIELRRNDRVISTFDLYDLLLRGDKSRDVPLSNGDVIYIPPVQNLAAVAGSVNNPAIYEIKQGTTLEDVLALAGGLTTTAAGQHVLVERISSRAVRSVDEFSLDDAGRKHVIRDGDLITVLALSKRFDNAITLRGNVATPGRYPYRPGMRVKDLIPDRQSLITNQYWLNQQALLNPEKHREEMTSRSAVYNSDVAHQAATRDARPLPPSRADTPPGGVPPESQQVGPGIDRGVNLPALRTQETLQSEIRRTSPDINWEYAVIQRLNLNDLTSELLPFNLRRAIDEPASDQNLLLKPGDVVTIFSQADLQVPIEQQSKYVRIEGEFMQAGVYKIRAGETLRQLVARLGGISPHAYLFGSVFTRESTRIAQQQKMDEAVNRLGQEVERSASVRAQNFSSPEEALGFSARIDSQRRMVDNLRKVRATGRIVLGLKPSAASVEDLPDMVLEDGDRFFVPYAPSTVTVLGAVYNENDFIWKDGWRIRDYLRQSGGTTRSADASRVYVIRADGSVRGKHSGSGWLSSSFQSDRLNRGDTVVVPEKLDRVGFIRNLKDYTQIFSQFALGAAAINVLK